MTATIHSQRPVWRIQIVNGYFRLGHVAEYHERLLNGDGPDHQIQDCRVDRLSAWSCPIVLTRRHCHLHKLQGEHGRLRPFVFVIRRELLRHIGSLKLSFSA